MFRPTRTVMLALASVTALVLAACGGGGEGSAAGAGDRAAAAPVTAEVTLTDFAIEPAALEVPAGAPVTITVVNHGAAPHTFGVVVDGETLETPTIQAEGTASLDLSPLDAGEYETLCTVPGHADLGMVGTLVAGADAAAVAAADGSAAPLHAAMTAEEMAAGHEAGVKAFLAGDETDTQGNQVLEPVVEAGVKTFELTVSAVSWEVSKGEFVDALAFNGQVPGPEVRVRQGDRVRFVVQNQMDQPFALHFHGVTVPNEMDGVPYVTQPPVMPGEYWTYEFGIVDRPGIYVYHSHFNSAEQVDRGLYGALIVQPRRDGWRSVYGVEPDVETTLFVGDGALGYNLNGKSFPATSPIVAEDGDWVLVHLSNDGQQIHPMHLHGFHFQVVGVDGIPLAPRNRYLADTLPVAPGQRFDILVRADEPGAWALHCHVLTHVEAPNGMFGMVTVLVVA